MFNEPNLDIADEIFATDFVAHLPLAPELDRDAWKAYVASLRAGASNTTEQVNQVIITEDRVILHVTYNGRHDGTLFGVPATGNPILMNGIGIFRFNEEGLAVENWAVLDVAGVLAQIGAFPPAA
ncbi:MAG: ester cyclase [Chloroflexota bacterium]